MTFAERVRSGETVIGYWVTLDAPEAVERLARAGYDYVCLDGQHGLFGYRGMRDSLIAIDAAGAAAGLVRVEANDPTPIGRALDAGAVGIIVPLVSSAAEAAAAVAAAKYPPLGIRSYGPMRASREVGTDPATANERSLVLAMIETPDGLANVEEIAATPGLDGLYIGPSDLMLAVGGARPGDPDHADDLEAAMARTKEACEAAGIVAAVHTPSGEVAARRVAQGFTFVTISCDLDHLDDAARAHLATAQSR